jgi:large-conductance mechanosensitive channel
MNDSQIDNNSKDNDIESKKIVFVICFIVLIIVGFYFYNNGLSKDNDVWGAFGDYVGGILNPIIAAFAFYLIAKTYELQKTELEETRKFLKISTKAQLDQLRLAAMVTIFDYKTSQLYKLENRKMTLMDNWPSSHNSNTTGLAEGIEKARISHDFHNINIEPLNIEIERINKEIEGLSEKINMYLKEN